MLLSTDWFLNHWSSLGLTSPVSARLGMKEECQDIVTRIYSGECDYWLVSFDEARIRATYDDFFTAASASNVTLHDIELLHRLADQTATESVDAEQNELLESLTQLLVSDRDPDVIKDLPSHLIQMISRIHSAVNNTSIDFVALSIGSETKWDSMIRSMTSGLPEYLADFASSTASQSMKFPQFWGVLINNISGQELQSLLRWYEETSLELANRQLNLTRLVP